MSWLALGLLALCLQAGGIGCAAQRPVELPASEAWTLAEFAAARLVRKCELPSGDPRRAALQAWLNRNSRGWISTPLRQMFIPGTLITGASFSLNLSPLGVAVFQDSRGRFMKSKFRGMAPELRCPVTPAPRP
jgi:hypothetical protein